MSNKLGQSPRRTRIPLSGVLGGAQRQTLCQRAAWAKHSSVSAPLHVFLLLLLSFERRSGNLPPPPARLAPHRPAAGSSHIKAGSLPRWCLRLQPRTPRRPLVFSRG